MAEPAGFEAVAAQSAPGFEFVAPAVKAGQSPIPVPGFELVQPQTAQPQEPLFRYIPDFSMLDVAPTSVPAPRPQEPPPLDPEAEAVRRSLAGQPSLTSDMRPGLQGDTSLVAPGHEPLTTPANVLPAPYMQAALEGGAMGIATGGARAAWPTAIDMALGTKAAELAAPAIEQAIPGEGIPSQVGRGVAETAVMMLPGLGRVSLAEMLRRQKLPPAAPRPEPPPLTEPFTTAPPAELAPGWLEAGRPPEPPPIPARQALAGLRQRPPGFEAPIPQPEPPRIAAAGPIEGGQRLLASPIRENGARTSIVLENGTALVGGQNHGETYNAAIERGLATESDLAGASAAFTRPDGTSWDLQGKPVGTQKVINLDEHTPQPTARERYGLPEAGTIRLYRAMTAEQYAEWQRTGIIQPGGAARASSRREVAEYYARERGPGARVAEFDANVDDIQSGGNEPDSYRIRRPITTHKPPSAAAQAPSDPALVDRIQYYRDIGWSDAQIGREFSISEAQVRETLPSVAPQPETPTSHREPRLPAGLPVVSPGPQTPQLPPVAAAPVAGMPVAEPRARGQRWVGKKEEIIREPERFQFKGDTDVAGMGAEMKAARAYNPQLDQGLTLWRDPADGNLRVINGFNRLGKAHESGYVGNLEGDIIDLTDAADARVFGALENIAQGRGTALDAAKIFRDAKLTTEQIEARGVSLEGRNAKLGLGLANLDDALFRKVVIGELSEKQGAMIGRELPDQAAQRGLWPHLAEGELTDGQLRSLIVQSQLAPVVAGEQEGFSFNTPRNKSLAVPKAKVTDYIDSQLATEKRSFTAVGKQNVADILSRGGNIIETESNRARALGAAQLREMFGKEIRHSGEVNDLLNDAARRIARGEEPNVVFPETYRAVLDQLRGTAGIDTEAAASVGRSGAGEVPPAQEGLFGARPAGKATVADILKGEKGAFVVPGGESAKAFVEKVKKSASNAARVLNPAGRASEESLNSIVGRKGDDIEAVRFQYNQASKNNEAFFDRMIGAEKRRGGSGTDWLPDYLSRVSTGQKLQTPELQAIADFHRKALDAQRLGEARARGRVGKGTVYIEDYFPGLFKQPGEAERWLGSRRPMRGTEGYNEKKFWTDVGLAMKPKSQGGGGLEPISPNPEVLVRTRLEDGRKAVWAYDVMADGRESGRWTWVGGERGKLPDGKAWLDDAIARKYFAPGQFVPAGESSAGGIPMQPLAGRWAVDEAEALILNNSLSRNWIMEEPTLRGVLLANAKLNGLQLGLSGFHMQNEASEAFATMWGQTLARFARGVPLKALSSLVRVPTAPLEFFIRGTRAWNDPILYEGPMSPLRNGMRLAQPEGTFAPGSAWDNFMRASRRMELGRALVNLPGAIIDLAQAPIFKWMVPRMKAGAYLIQLQDEFERNAAGIASGKINPRTLARKLTESIDNRMGQVNYDNWFWNNTFKSAMQITFRAVGWNFGFGRSLNQTGKDIKGNLSALFRGGPSPGFTPDMQYWAGMIFAQVSAAALYQYLHTGKGLESPEDALYPRNGQIDAHGNEIRVRFANPLKDLYGFTRGISEGNPLMWASGVRDTLGNKLGPVPVEFVRVLLTNKDYFGDYIRNENDPTLKQFGQVFDYLTQVATPFSIQQRSRISEAPGIGAAIEAFAGITKAPGEVITSPLEKEIRATGQEVHGTRGPRTPQQKALDRLKVKAREGLKTADTDRPKAVEALKAWVVEASKQGRPVTAASLNDLLKSKGKTNLQRQFESLPKNERLRIGKEFAQP
jgi:hypothetical protein